MANLLDQCHEVLHWIFQYLSAEELSSLSQTCRAMKSYTQDNGLLWREIYLSEFDDPRKTFKKRQPNWEQEIKPLVKFQKILRSPKASVKSENMEFVCKTAVQLATEADHAGESKNLEKLRGFFENADDNSNMFIHGSRLYEMTARRKKANITEEMSQLIAQLHCLHGVKTVEYRLLPTPDFMSEIPLRAHPYARSIVYDIATYSDGNKWGPFSDSGDLSIDWEKVEAIMVDLAYNLNLYDDHTDSLKSDMRCEPFDGVQPDSYKSVIAEPDSDGTESVSDTSSWSASRESVLPPQLDLALEARDPYGVTGTWERVVCFLDYNDFVRFNFDRDLTVRRPPVHTQEALRLIRMLVHVTKIEEPGEMDGKELPVVHFEGRACSMHMLWDPNSNSRLTGTARLTPNGDVRWATLSIFQGEPRWRSEGVQIGGIRSKRGVIGTWFDHVYDDEGPAGPTAFWKIHDSIAEVRSTRQLPTIFQ